MCALKSLIKSYGVALLFFIALGTVVFRCAWEADQVFSGSDANIGLTQRGRMLLPEDFTGAYVSAPLLGEDVQASFSFSNLGQWVLSAPFFTDVWYAFFLIVSSLALIAYLRLWQLQWASCVFGALTAFWVGSVTMSGAGHIYKLGVMAFFSIALFLVEKSVRSPKWNRQLAYALLTGLCIGLMLLEQQDVGLFAGLFLGVYTIFRLIMCSGRRVFRWLLVLSAIALVAIPLAAPTALKAYSRNVTEVGMKEDPEHQWNFVTQWSMVPAELPDLIAPGYTGWSTGNPDAPYWGAVGQSPEWADTQQGFRNFRLDSLYIGVIPIFLAIIGFTLAARYLKKKDEISPVFFFWGILSILALLLSFGKFSLLYEGFYHLPLVGNIRAPIKLLHNFQVIIGILAAFGLNHLLYARSDEDKQVFTWSLRIAAVLAVFMGIASLVFRGSSMQGFFADWGNAAPLICNGISKAWFHAAVMAVLFCLAVFFGRKKPASWNRGIVSVLLLAVICDSVYLTSRYFRADNFAALKSGNPVINYLKENQGAERVYCFSQDGVYNIWISVDFLYHDIQAFNFGQMPRMPNDYKAFLSSVGNDWHRFMQLTSSRYGLAPAQVYAQIVQQGGSTPSFIKPVSGFRFVNGNGRISTEWIKQISHPSEQVLFECTDVPPRFALFPAWKTASDKEVLRLLGAAEFSPATSVLLSDQTPVDAGSVACPMRFETVELKKYGNTKAIMRIATASGGILRFNQRYDAEWTVFVDGKTRPLLKCNYINMGVYVPSGEHQVEFRCPKKPGPFVLQASMLLVGLLVPIWLLRRGKSETQG